MLLKIKLILSDHKWAILSALAAAIIIAFPQIYLRYDLGDFHQNIEFTNSSDDESSWMSRVREAQDGHLTFSCVYFKDAKNDPYLMQPLGTIIFASLGDLFSFDINNTLLASRFLFSFIVFLIIYAFVYLFSKGKLIALAGTFALVLGRDIFSRGGFIETLTIGAPSFKFLNLFRPVNPLMTYFFFFGFLLFFWLFVEKKQWRWGILSALMLGLSFYDYFFTWTFLYAFCGTLLLFFLFKKKRQDAKRIGFVLISALIIAIPYFINLYQASTFNVFEEAGQRFGLIESRSPVIGTLAPLLFAVVLLFFPRAQKDRYYFALALVIAPFIALNYQVIIGKTLSNVHYHWYFNFPLAIIFFLITFWLWVSGRGWHFFDFLKKTLAVFVIAISIFSGILVQAVSYDAHKEEIAEMQKYGKVMDWLNQNAKAEEVVFADDRTSDLILIYTPLNLFYHFKGQMCLASSKERLLDTLFVFYRLKGIEKDEARDFFFDNRGDISHYMYSMYYDFTTGSYAGIPDEIISDFSKRYQDSFSLTTAEFIKSMFKKYEVKYAVWDKKANPQWQIDKYPFLEKTAEIGDFAIYEQF